MDRSPHSDMPDAGSDEVAAAAHALLAGLGAVLAKVSEVAPTAIEACRRAAQHLPPREERGVRAGAADPTPPVSTAADGAANLPSITFTPDSFAAMSAALADVCVVETHAVAPSSCRRSGAVGPRTSAISDWVTAEDVQRALQCSRSKAHEFLREAAGRRVADGRLLRAPADVWEAWARENLLNGRRREPCERENLARLANASSSAGASASPGFATTAEGSVGVAATRPAKRKLGPGSPSTSVRPLIPLLGKRKR